MENGITDKQRRALFSVFKKMGYDSDSRHEFISEWTGGRTQSLTEIGFEEAQLMLTRLNGLLGTADDKKSRDDAKMDRLRKRVMASIYGYIERLGIETTEEYVKGVAVKASRITPTGIVSHDFNKISRKDLSRIYSEFRAKQHIDGVKKELDILKI